MVVGIVLPILTKSLNYFMHIGFCRKPANKSAGLMALVMFFVLTDYCVVCALVRQVWAQRFCAVF